MKVKKILLINPPGKCYLKKDGSLGERKHCTPPLGLAYLASNLLRCSYDVEVLDVLAEGYNNEKFVDPFIVYGLDIKDVLRRVEESKPDLIGVSLCFSNRTRESLEIINAIKKKFPNILIVIGGHHPTGAPLGFIKNQNIDFVLLGEADISLAKLVDNLNGLISIDNVPGLYYKDGTEVRNTFAHIKPAVAGKGWLYFDRMNSPSPKRLEELPYPAWHLFPMKNYWNSDVRVGGGDIEKERFAVMVTTRGCVWSCYFCASSLMAGYKAYRLRPIDDITREIRWLIDKFAIEEIMFLDDNFFTNRQRTKDLLKTLAREFADTVFSVPAGTEVNSLDDEVIDLMAKANFHKVTIAVESGDKDIQERLIDKKVKIGRLSLILEHIRARGMESRLLFMIGFPGETREQIKHTIDLAMNSDADDFYISVVTPLPGTKLYDECVEHNLLYDDFDINNLRYSVSNIKLPDMGKDEIEGMRRDIWLKHADKRAVSKQDISKYENAGFTKMPRKFRDR